MDKREIEQLREKVGCAALLETEGWKVDIKESTRRAIKYRRGEGEIVIVIHDGRGWFDPLSTAKGDVFSLAEHLGAGGFVDACDRVASVVGFIPNAPAWQRPAKVKTIASIADRWGHRFRLRPGSSAWEYLTGARALPADIVVQAVAGNQLREGPYGSMWAAHRDSNGTLTGWEERGPEWRGFATDGTKELFRLGRAAAERICITEAAIDAMSLAVIEVLRSDTLYVSTGGGWSAATDQAIRLLAQRANVRLVAATDNNRQGEVYAERIRAIAAETRAQYARSRPRADDWNEDLMGLVKRPQSELVA
ncbi:MAG: hypothetical protein CFE29_28565 [Bradyrhizobiaceae bacterium PARB1]|jgi:hypothetical protein|nr:MAG: hypothetical protein CFE29_28565 [Bradyrhizobiaceae bacterium PARB1]